MVEKDKSGGDMNMPIIRLEVEGIKRTMMVALSEHAAQMDEDIRMAVDEYCTPENIRAVVQGAARKQLHAAIAEEVRSFFHHGPGRKAVAEAVKESILKNETYTPLDNVDSKP